MKKSVTDFAKTAEQPAPEKVNAEEGVYYLVNPDGEFERAFGHDVDSLAIALAVGQFVLVAVMHIKLICVFGSAGCFVLFPDTINVLHNLPAWEEEHARLHTHTALRDYSCKFRQKPPPH